MNLKMKNKTLLLCLPAILNVPFWGGLRIWSKHGKRQ